MRRPGDEIGALFELSEDGFAETFAARLRVLSAEQGRLEIAVIDAPSALRVALAQSAEEADILLLPGVSPTVSPVTTEPPRRFFKRAAIQVVVSLAVLAALMTLAYRHFSSVTVPDGMVVANDLPLGVSVPAQFTRLAVKVGQKVNAGDILFETDGGTIMPAVKSAEAMLNTAQTGRESLMGQIEEEQARLELYARVSNLRIERQKSKIRATEAEVSLAQRELERNKTLFEQKAITDKTYRQAQDACDFVLATLEEDKVDLKLLELNLEASAQGRYFDGKEIQGRLGEFKQQLRVAESRVAQAQQDLENARVRLKDVNVQSPVAGTIFAVYHHIGENLTPNSAVLSINTGEGCSVIGSLAHDEAVFVRPGMAVDVEMPTERLVLKGHVEAIGRRAISAGAEGWVSLEVSAQFVPFKVAFDEPSGGFTPGVRAEVNIHLPPLARLIHR